MAFRLSIITATYNRCDFLGRCIESVAAQPYPDKEHIIVDGGSTDGTVELLREYAARYPHIRWISEPDRGISDAFNKGLAMMTGDAFGIIGDDDFYEPDTFPLVAQAFDRHPEAGVVSGNCAFLRNDDSTWLVQRASFTSRRDLIECWVHWGKDVVIPAPSSFIRRSVVDDVGGFELADRWAMDYHHWIKITAKYGIHTIDTLLANFRCDQGSVSHSRIDEQWRETIAISRRYWGSKFGYGYYLMLLSYLNNHHRFGAGKAIATVRKKLRRLPGRIMRMVAAPGRE